MPSNKINFASDSRDFLRWISPYFALILFPFGSCVTSASFNPQNARAGQPAPTAKPEMSEDEKRTRYNELGGLEGIYNLVKDGPEEDKEKFVDMVQDF